MFLSHPIISPAISLFCFVFISPASCGVDQSGVLWVFSCFPGPNVFGCVADSQKSEEMCIYYEKEDTDELILYIYYLCIVFYWLSVKKAEPLCFLSDSCTFIISGSDQTLLGAIFIYVAEFNHLLTQKIQFKVFRALGFSFGQGSFIVGLIVLL